MKRLDCEPRTADWHAARNECATASESAALCTSEAATALKFAAAEKGITLEIDNILKLGLTSYFGNTPWKTWATKQGLIPRFKGNADTQRGVENEELVIQHFESAQLVIAEREVTAISSEYDGLLASFDAIAPASSDPSEVAPYGFPVEAKCPAFHSRKKLWEAKKAGTLAIMGLPYYWCQVQQQIYVAQAPYAWFVAAGVEEGKIVFPIVEKVPRDDAFLKEYVALAKFYHEEYILNGNEPPKLASDNDLLSERAERVGFEAAIRDSNYEAAVDQYAEALKAAATAAALVKDMEEKLLKAAKDIRAEGTTEVVIADRLQVTYSTSETTSWQKVVKGLLAETGLTEVPEAILTASKSKAKESVKIKLLDWA